MATENKKLNTRILLKYDTYSNWTTNNPKLLKGEVAIATIESGNTQKVNSIGLPQVLIKVGDGSSNYNALPFVSGLAADVYGWAKAENKPSYEINEIAGAKEYQVVKGATEYAWELQARKAGSNDAWTKVSDIDLSAISARIKEVEDDVADHETRLGKAEGTIGDASSGLVKDVAELKALMGENGEGSVADRIDDAINALDSTKTQSAGADGLALSITQENGVITAFSGSIAAETYDKYGAAKEAVEALDATVTHAAGADGLAIEIVQTDGKLTGLTASIAAETYDEYGAADAAVNALNTTGVEGAQEGTTIKFVDKVSQANGIVSAELGELVFESAYNASTNKAATMADVTSAVADLNGAMHFEGFSTTDPESGITIDGKADYVAAAGDVVIYQTIEYVYDGSKWQKLGEEGALGAALEALASFKNVAADETVKTVVQSNGVVTVEAQKIQIAEGQVTGLTDKLAAMQKEIDDEEARADGVEKVLAGRLDTVQGADTTKSMRTVASEEASSALGALNHEKTLGADETVLVAKQANGAVSVTSQKIQIAESQVTGLTAALALKATEADLTLAENRIKANEDAIALINSTTIQSKIDDSINALDKADTAVAGQVVTAVSQENGIITVSRAAVNVKDLEQTADTYVVFDCGSSSINI